MSDPWQSIKIAPRDGTKFDAWVTLTRFHDDGRTEFVFGERATDVMWSTKARKADDTAWDQTGWACMECSYDGQELYLVEHEGRNEEHKFTVKRVITHWMQIPGAPEYAA